LHRYMRFCRGGESAGPDLLVIEAHGFRTAREGVEPRFFGSACYAAEDSAEVARPPSTSSPLKWRGEGKQNEQDDKLR